MNFFHKKTKTNFEPTTSFDTKMTPVPGLHKKRRKKIVLYSCLGIFVLFLTFSAVLVSKGAKIFDKESGGLSSIFQSVNGSGFQADSDGRTNVLVMGLGGSTHPGGMLTDSMMVISYDSKGKAIAMLSIPRDLYVKIPDHKVSTKINEAYSIGELEKKGTGAALAKKTVASVLDIPIQYYVTLDFKGFESIVNTLGGIDVYVDRAIYDPSYPDEKMQGYAPFSIKAGQQHLDGKTALKYARSRESTSDFDRAARQQKVISAIKDKALSLGFLGNPKKILDMVSTLSSNLRTDFNPSEIKELLAQIKDIPSDKIIHKVLDDSANGALVADSSSGTFYLKPKDATYDEIHKIAQNIFSTAAEDTDTKATISVLNGTTTSGQAAKLAADLKTYGYTVEKIDQAKTLADRTIIYDYNNGKNKTTLEFLKTGLGATVVTGATNSNTNTSQVEIIIGSDYKGFTPKK